MFLSTALVVQQPSSGDKRLELMSCLNSYVAEASDGLILLSANLSRAGQAWSMTVTGNQRCLNIKSEGMSSFF